MTITVREFLVKKCGLRGLKGDIYTQKMRTARCLVDLLDLGDLGFHRVETWSNRSEVSPTRTWTGRCYQETRGYLGWCR